jgi:hypothetical protein
MLPIHISLVLPLISAIKMSNIQAYALLLLGLLLGCPALLQAQTYGNEWIRHDQQYMRIGIGADGLYKISYQDMQKVGFPVDQLDPRSLQLFHRGVEQAIEVAGESDGRLQATDYVLFYGKRNDGTLDKELYLSPELQPHNYYNLYSDTTAYFLTFRPGGEPGRRMEQFSRANSANLSPEPYYWDERLMLFTDNYVGGKVYEFAGGLYTYLSNGDEGEGWSGTVIANVNSRSFTLSNLTNAYTAGPAPELSMQLMGRNNIDRTIPVEIGPTATSLTTVHTATFSGASIYNVQEQLGWNVIGNDQSIVRVSTDGTERVSVSYLKFRYARAWNMANQSQMLFRLQASTVERYIEIQNVPTGAQVFDISNPDGIKRIAFLPENNQNGTIKAVIPPSSTEQLILVNTDLQEISWPKKVQFRQLPSNSEFIIVSNKLLMKPAGGYADPVRAYGAFRASAAGGNYDTLVVEVQELYDQFSYGESTPVGIRRFARYLAQDQLPKAMFIIGKGLTVNHRYYRNPNWTNINRDLVPTYGWPGADIPFVANINGSGFAPAYQIGRLSVNTPEDVAAYLKKVIEDETQSPKDLWRKRLAHLSGGISASETQLLKAYLQSLQTVAEGPYLGADVRAISKTEDAVVQKVDISTEVNNGVRLITLFGHSAPHVTDIDINFASDPRSGYTNRLLYPRILVNGCDAGNIYTTGVPTLGEDWLFAPEKGAVNFVAHSSVGYTSLLYQYSYLFYQISATDENFLGASMGAVLQESARRFLSTGTITAPRITQVQQMVLQGDPTLVLFDIRLPDFATSDEEVNLLALNNQPLNLSADSLAITAIISNFGKVISDSLVVQLEYWLNDGTPKVLDVLSFPSPFHKDTIAFHIGTKQLDGPGLSNFRITLNPGGEIEESDITNNIGTIQVLLPAGGTVNILPYNYAVINKGQVKLLAQGTNSMAPVRGFRLQLDTATSFASGSLQQTQVQAKTLAAWQVTLPETVAAPSDTIVYFWNSRLSDPNTDEDASPVRSSFTYIKGASEGWAQAHEGQFAEGKITNMQVKPGRNWVYTPLSKKVEVVTWGAKTPNADFKTVSVKIDGEQLIYNVTHKFCSNNSINAVHFDKNTLDMPLAKPNGWQYYQSCGRWPQQINNFQAADMIYGDNDNYNLERYLREIPEGDWILLFSIGNNNYSQWPASVKAQVQNLGIEASVLNQLTNGEPVIILGRKGGGPGSAIISLADKSEGALPPSEQIIQLSETVSGTPGIGFVETPVIGPAASWHDLAIVVKEQAGDSWELKVVGVNAQQQESVLQQISQSGTTPLAVDAAQYPYMRLRIQLNDPENQTPPQLRFWRVGYQPLPEGVLLVSDTVQRHYSVAEGSVLKPGFKFINISQQTYAADSLEVRSSLFNTTRSTTQQRNFKIKAPAPGDTIRFANPLYTEKNGGDHNLLLRVNPYPTTEVTLVNNVFDVRKFLSVKGDSLHPFIDVAFDGSYISSGEIVSPNPLISVMIRDENRIKFKQDTTGIHLYLKRECEGCTAERINLQSAAVRFYPATPQENCRVEFAAGPLEDGFYTLQVQAEDASGNKAGTRPYSISFEVVSESSVTHFYPYPNPFSTSTRFVFTLTGNEIPDDLKIQIMTVSGKVVREIMKEELGPLRIGNNLSQYAWDGTDEWGDRLANGVYLYRVVFGGSNGSIWKHRATKGDKAFKQQFGKLYILR